jgi:epoxyqueuosine reductase QueG
LINPKYGSKIFLAAFLSTEYLQPEKYTNTNTANSNVTNSDITDFNSVNSKPETTPVISCNNCRRCLTSCPTGALVQPFVLDARRCLNYWTIEHRGEIPMEIREQLGQHFFGCDICMNICPHNRNCPAIPEGTIDPKTLNTAILYRIASGSPLERMFR